MWGGGGLLKTLTIIMLCLTLMICDHNNDCLHQNLEKRVIFSLLYYISSQRHHVSSNIKKSTITIILRFIPHFLRDITGGMVGLCFTLYLHQRVCVTVHHELYRQSYLINDYLYIYNRL